MNTRANPQPPRVGRMRSWLLWTSLACVSALGVIAYLSDASRSALTDAPAGLIAAPASHQWLFFSVIAALIVLVVHASTSSETAQQRRADTSYRYLFESSPLPMWVMEDGSWRIVEVNPAATEKYGYSRDEFLRLTAVDLQWPEDRETFVAQLRGRDPVAATSFRRRHLTKAGDTIVAEVTARPFQFGGRAARLILVNDVTMRVTAERDLQESEARYRDLFERSPMPMWVYDVETLRFLAVNEAAVHRYGYSEDEFRTLTIADLHVPEDVPGVLARMEMRQTDAHFERHARHRTRDGTVLEMDIRSGPVRFAGRRARQVLAHDITERVRMERALREGEERLRTIADNVPALIGYVDAERRYRFANRMYEEWYGVAPSGMIGKTVAEVLGAARYEAVRGDVDTALAGREVTAERAVHGRTGEIIARVSYIPHIGHGGEVEGFHVLGYDVTERRKAEEAVTRERALLRAVIDNLPDNIYVKDVACRYLLMNPAGLAVRAVRREEDVLGRKAVDFYPADIAGGFDEEDRSVMASGKALVNRERRHTAADGTRQWFLSTKVPLRDGEGAVVGLVGIGRDITELRESAETIRQLNAELEQRVRERTAQLEMANRELEAFSYSVSHDLKAPLRSIEGFSRALREDYGRGLEPDAREFLQRISGASRRMRDLIDALLALSRVSRADMVRAPVNLTAIAEEIVAELRKAAPERTVRVLVAPDLVVQGDPNLLRVVLANLLDNAWKFTGRKAQAEIEIGAAQSGGEKVFFVRDNGAGFDMAYVERLFTAFHRLHGSREFPGTGIGLATVQRVIHRHGGRVWGEGGVGNGATFYFVVP